MLDNNTLYWYNVAAAAASVAMLLQVLVLELCYEYVLFVSWLLLISYTRDVVQVV